jgi:hypothetical protein
MSFLLWTDEEKDQAIDLGDPFSVLAAFGEMGRLDHGKAYATLYEVPHLGEQEVPPDWVARVRREARAFLAEYKAKLGEAAVWILQTLAGGKAVEKAARPVVSKSADFEETKHPRKKDGKFAPKGGGESGGGGKAKKKTPPAVHHLPVVHSAQQAEHLVGVVGHELSKSWDGLKRMGVKAGHAEHLAKEWVSGKCDHYVSKLPGPLQKVVRGTWSLTKVGTKAAFASYIAGQALAEKVSKAMGSTPEQAASLRHVLSAVDVAACKPVVIACELTGMGAFILPASMIPVGSTLYLAGAGSYLLAKKAKAAVKKALAKVGRTKALGDRSEVIVRELMQALKKAGPRGASSLSGRRSMSK